MQRFPQSRQSPSQSPRSPTVNDLPYSPSQPLAIPATSCGPDLSPALPAMRRSAPSGVRSSVRGWRRRRGGDGGSLTTDHLDAAIGHKGGAATMWYYDKHPRRLVPNYLWGIEVADPSGLVATEQERMRRKFLWSMYGQPMHFFNLEFRDPVTEFEYGEDAMRGNKTWVRHGTICVSIVMALVAFCLGISLFGGDDADFDSYVAWGSPGYFMTMSLVYLLQYAQLQLDAPFVHRHMQHVSFFWAMLQATCILIYQLVVMPWRRYNDDICHFYDVSPWEAFDRNRDLSPKEMGLLDLHNANVEKITAFALLALLIHRLRFVYFLYVNLYLLCGYFAFAVRTVSLHGSLSPCVPQRLHIRHVSLVCAVLSVMSYTMEVLHRKDFVQASMVWKESAHSQLLLQNILPGPVIEDLKRANGKLVAQHYQAVTVLFADVVGFTTMSSQISATELVELLNLMFHRFDDIAERNGVEKIKTIGDCYMCASGLPARSLTHAHNVARFGLQLLEAVGHGDFVNPATQEALRVRAGLHSGPAVAGVIGNRKFAYDLWGDAVNTASRMESHGEPMRLHCSADSYKLIQDYFICEPRDRMVVKGKGEMQTYFVLAEKLPQTFGSEVIFKNIDGPPGDKSHGTVPSKGNSDAVPVEKGGSSRSSGSNVGSQPTLLRETSTSQTHSRTRALTGMIRRLTSLGYETTTSKAGDARSAALSGSGSASELRAQRAHLSLDSGAGCSGSCDTTELAVVHEASHPELRPGGRAAAQTPTGGRPM